MTTEKSSPASETGACEVPLNEQCEATLQHYEHLATVAHEWNNQVPQAIRAWYAAKAPPSATPPSARRSGSLRYNAEELAAMFERSKIDHLSAAFVGSEVRVLIGMAQESLEAAPSATPATDYICKCGVRVTPHRCGTSTDF